MKKQNKPSLHPVLKFIILLAVYSLGYINGNIKQTQTMSSNSYDELTETLNGNSYNEIDETNSQNNELKTSKYEIDYNISYSDLNDNEKKLYDKIISTAIDKNNTFITNKELHFDLYASLSMEESARVQFVLYNNYPDVTFYTNRYSDSWMYYETKYLNGIAIHRTYYFNVKCK